jgi:purine-cytosine permease-like protein
LCYGNFAIVGFFSKATTTIFFFLFFFLLFSLSKKYAILQGRIDHPDASGATHPLGLTHGPHFRCVGSQATLATIQANIYKLLKSSDNL